MRSDPMTAANSSLQTRLYTRRVSLTGDNTLAGTIRMFLGDPDAWSLAIKYLPTPLTIPVGGFAGVILGAALAHYGIPQPPDTVMAAFCAGGMALGHIIWVWMQNHWFKPKLPTNQGVPTNGTP